MQWDDSPNAGFTTGTPFAPVIEGELGYQRVNVASQVGDGSSQFHAIRHMIEVRRMHQVFGRGIMEWVITDNPSVATYARKDQNETLLILNNLSGSSQALQLPEGYQGAYANLLTGAEYQTTSTLSLEPYAFLWLRQYGN
jgi:glycosidase